MIIQSQTYQMQDLRTFAGNHLLRLPFSLRILLENCLRNFQHIEEFEYAPQAILAWQPNALNRPAIPFMPSRILLQDLTGVPLLVDLAAMRSAKARLGADPQDIKPVIPVDLVIDHSCQVDFNQYPDSLKRNMTLEYQRNNERYQLIRWAQDAFENFRVVPPGKGIVHQVNLEFLASVVAHNEQKGLRFAFPDTLFGTDSHTTMINGLGVLGWGVGGIEAIAAMLGKPALLVLPDVIGLTFEGTLPEGSTPTDLTLTIVERLRDEGVVGKFIEVFGSNLDQITIPDRAMVANMTPETGATVMYFPVDKQTIDYLRLTGRSPHQVELVENYCKYQGLFRDNETQNPNFSKVIKINLSKVKPSLAGPFRPQDRIELPMLKQTFLKSAKKFAPEGVPLETVDQEKVSITINGNKAILQHGSLLIAAITSCTNTSNPMVMLAAGLLAKNAIAHDLQVSPIVKCSLMPGSQVVTAYLENAGLLTPLAQLGFNLVGYGCGTCIGNSGPLAPEIVQAIKTHPLITASISSGNRNFEGRIHPLTKMNYLASPPLVVAYTLAGRMNIDLTSEPLGFDKKGAPVFLADIYPTKDEIDTLFAENHQDLFKSIYAHIFNGDEAWNTIFSKESSVLFPWNTESTYIKEPPYFIEPQTKQQEKQRDQMTNARILALLGDSITTDHISPAGAIPPLSPAGEYLLSRGVTVEDFNTYGTRRGNHQVMIRGTFANIRLKNRLVRGVEGGYSRHFPSGEVMSIFEAAQKYADEHVPLIIIAGKAYGSGSSRDWAAKGPQLLGVKAIIAESFERIHRANLVGMGILPLSFTPGENAELLGLNGEEKFDLLDLGQLEPRGTCRVQVHRKDGTSFFFYPTVCIETKTELVTYMAGGILHEAIT